MISMAVHCGTCHTIEDVCVAWHIWDLPAPSHSRLLGPISGILPLIYDLSCRCAFFIGKSLESANWSTGL